MTIGQAACQLLCRQTQSTLGAFDESCSLLRVNQANELVVVILKSYCYWVLAPVCTAPTLSKSEMILMSLNSKQKSICQLATI